MQKAREAQVMQIIFDADENEVSAVELAINQTAQKYREKEKTFSQMVRGLNEEEIQILLNQTGLTEEQLVKKVIEEDQKKLGTWGKVQRKKSDRKILEQTNLGTLLQNSVGKMGTKEFKQDIDEDPLLGNTEMVKIKGKKQVAEKGELQLQEENQISQLLQKQSDVDEAVRMAETSRLTVKSVTNKDRKKLKRLR